jgi:ATP-binding cassette, subfamily F, member 3
MMSNHMVHFSNVSKQYGTQILYQNASFQVRDQDRIGLVGPNGAGKSTIFRIIAGEESVDKGTVSIDPKLVIGYFSQDVAEMHGRSALEEVKAGVGRISELAAKIADCERKLQATGDNALNDDQMMKVVEAYGEYQLEFEARDGYNLDARVKAILTGLGIGPDAYDRPVESFSGGWKMRIELAKILALQPDVLLMDEPTNHLDLETILWLEDWLQNFKGALIMTSHDRDFMNGLVTKIVEVANKTITSYTGNYDFYLREREIRRSQLQAQFDRQQEMLAKEEEFIARFAARASHAAQVQSRVKKLEKIERIEIPAEEKTINFEFPNALRSGNDVVKFTGLGQTYETSGQKKVVFQGLNGLVRRLEKVAVVGVNGAGKSTLLKIMAQQLEPSTGTCVMGPSVLPGYFSQSALDILNPKNTIFEEISAQIPEATIGWVRNLLGAFLFSGDDADKKIGVLSGGEKSRVVLAMLLSKPRNLLILDEPTNHLDIRSREILLDSLKKFEGTVVIVSHDRYFLKELTTRVFEVDHGELMSYDMNFQEYLANTKKKHDVRVN